MLELLKKEKEKEKEKEGWFLSSLFLKGNKKKVQAGGNTVEREMGPHPHPTGGGVPKIKDKID